MSPNLLGLLLLCTITSARPPEYHHVDEEVVSTAERQDSFAVTSMGQPMAPPSSMSASLAAAAASAAAGRTGMQVASVPQAAGGSVGGSAGVGLPPPPPAQATGAPASAGVAAQQTGGPGGRLVRPNAASIAQEAALEAKAASDAQLMAGQQAAHQVKAQLAERAQQAAQAAQAALVGKQQMMEQLEEEVREAQAVVQEEGASLQMAQQEVQAASASAQQAQQQLKVLTSAVQLEQANVGNAEQAATGAQQELTEKTQLVEAARRRVQMLLSQLSVARSDFTNTRTAADKALQAAQEAKINAARSRRAGPLSRREALDVKISAPKCEKHSTSMVPPPGLEEQEEDREGGRGTTGGVSRERRAPTPEHAQTEAEAPSHTADDATSVQDSTTEPSTGDGDGSRTAAAAAASEGITNSATGVGFTEDATPHVADDVTQSFTDDVTRSLTDDADTTVQLQRDRRHAKRSGRSFFSKFLPSRLIPHGEETQNLKKGNAVQGTILTESIENGVNENTKQSRTDGAASLERSNEKRHRTDDVEWGQSAECVHKKKGGKRRRAASTLDEMEDNRLTEHEQLQGHLPPQRASAFQVPKMSAAPLGMEVAGDARELRKSNLPEGQEVSIRRVKDYNKQVPIENKVLPRNFQTGVAKVEILKATKYEPIARCVHRAEVGEFESDLVSARGEPRGVIEKKLGVVEQNSNALEDSRMADAEGDTRRKRRNIKMEINDVETDLQRRNVYFSTDSALVRRERESYSTVFKEVSDTDERTRDKVELTEADLNTNEITEMATNADVRERRDNLESYRTFVTDATEQTKIEKRENGDVTGSQTEFPADGNETPSILTSVRVVGGNSGLKHSKVSERHHREIPVLQSGSMLSLEDSTEETLEKERFPREISESPIERYGSDDHETRESKTQEEIQNQHVIPELQSKPPGGENYVTKQADQKERRCEREVRAEAPTEENGRYPREATKLNVKSVVGENKAEDRGTVVEERVLREVNGLETERSNLASEVTKHTFIIVRYNRDVTESNTEQVDKREEVRSQSKLRVDIRRREIPSVSNLATALISDVTNEDSISENLPREITVSIPISIISDMEVTTQDEREKRQLQESTTDMETEHGDKEGNEEGQSSGSEQESKRVKKELEVQKEHGAVEGGLKPLDERYPHSASSHEVVPDKEQRRVKKELKKQKLDLAEEWDSKKSVHEIHQRDLTESIMMDDGKETINKPERSRRELTESQTDDTKETKDKEKREVTDEIDGITGTKLEDKSERGITEVQTDLRTDNERPARAIVDSHSDIGEDDLTTENGIRNRNRRQMTETQTEQTVFISGFKRHTKAHERHELESQEEFVLENQMAKDSVRNQRDVDIETKDETEKERRNMIREERQVFDARIGKKVEVGEKAMTNDDIDEKNHRKIAKSVPELNNFDFPSKPRVEPANERGILDSRKQNSQNDIDSLRLTADPEAEKYGGSSTDADLKERLKRGISEPHEEYFENVPFLKERRQETLELRAAGGLDSIALLGDESFNREGHRSKFDVIKRESNEKERLTTTFTVAEDRTATATVTHDRTVTYANGGSMWISGVPQELIALDDLKVDPEPSNTHRRVKRNRRDTAFPNHNQFYFNLPPETRLQRDPDNQNPFQNKRDTREFFQRPPFNIRESNNPGVISGQQYIDFLNYLPLLNPTPDSNVSKPGTARDVIDPSKRGEVEVKKGRNGGKCVGVAPADILESDPWGAPGGRVLRVETR